MIIDKFVNVTINSSNIKHYISLNYDVERYETISVPVEHLTNGSHAKIRCCSCDVCEKIVFIEYRQYYKNYNKYKYYACSRKCCQNKIKKTCLEKYGVKRYVNTEKNNNLCITKRSINSTKNKNNNYEPHKNI